MLLASVSNSLKVWNFDQQSLGLTAECNFIDPNLELNSVTWNHNQLVVAVAGNCSNIYLVQASTGQVLSSLPFKEEDKIIGDVMSLSFSHNSRYLASTNNSNAVIWDLKKRSIHTILEGHRHNINSLLFAPDGILLTGDLGGNLRAWNVDRNTSTADLCHKSLHSPLNSLQLSPSARQLSTGYDDGSVTLWSMESIAPTGHLSSLHEGPVTALSYSPKNERLLASSGKDGNIHLVDVSMNSTSPAMSIRTSEVIRTISFHESSLFISAGTSSGFIYLYDWRNAKKPLYQVPPSNHHPIRCVIFQKMAPKSSALNQSAASVSSSVASGENNEATHQKAAAHSSISFPPSPPERIGRDRKPDLEPSPARLPNNSSLIDEKRSVDESISLPTEFGGDFLDNSRVSLLKEFVSEIDPSEGGGAVEGEMKKKQPVSSFELAEALQLLRYDIHQDLHGVMREQVRQFALAKVLSFSLLLF
jgi:WD40 repeat protein